MLPSPQVVSHCYEIWLFAPGEPPELLSLCGPFRSRESADAVRAALLDWFRLGRWVDAVLDGLTADACADVFEKRQGYKCAGTDPADVLVVVKRAGVTAGLRIAFAAPDLDADEDDDDTTLQPVSVPFSNCLEV